MTIRSDAAVDLQNDAAKMSRVNLYGLHYSVNLCNTLNRFMLLKALTLNDTWNELTDAQVEKFESKLAIPTSCTTCCN